MPLYVGMPSPGNSARWFVYLYFLLSCIHFVSPVSEDGLQYLQILFRHGDRSPVQLYPKDPNPESFWVEGLGKLTKLGRQQHYNLGKYFHNRYKDFISTNPNEIDVLSSDVDRCLKSALTNLASFYDPSPEWKFENVFHWQPITVLYVPKDQDKYLGTEPYCPRATEERKKILASPKGREINQKYQALYDTVTKNSGSVIKNWIDAAFLYDILSVERKYNLIVPSWAIGNWKQLSYIHNMAFYWSYDSKLMWRLRVGPLIGKIVENMRRKVTNQASVKKVQIFSAHDTNMALVMQALNVYNWIQPPYGATLVFELHRMKGNNSVRILLWNSTAPEIKIEKPHLLELSGCTEFCPLEYFINYTAYIIPDDWEAECKMEAGSLL